MTAVPKIKLTPEEYLEIERKAEFKSEYFAGEMYAMSGATERHNLIVWNLAFCFGQQLRQRPCKAYFSDMRVRVEESGLYTYPDAVALCGPALFLDKRNDTLLNPQVIIEVLSESTEAYDRGHKFAQYRKVESLREYVLISQNQYRIEQFVRQEGSQWLYSETSDPGAVARLSSIECELRVADVYEKVEFPPVVEGGVMRPMPPR
jgi:Uma2 family endonuclease